MVIKEALQQLENSANPVAKLLHKGEQFKVLVIAFKANMLLKEHQANLPSKLTVLSGKVIYSQENEETVLEQYDEFIIPVHINHSVKALADSLCLLTQG